MIKTDDFEVRFQHIPRERGVETICTTEAEGVKVVGRARCSPNDSFCKKTGRRLAFKRAISALSKDIRMNITELFNKKEGYPFEK